MLKIQQSACIDQVFMKTYVDLMCDVHVDLYLFNLIFIDDILPKALLIKCSTSVQKQRYSVVNQRRRIIGQLNFYFIFLF